MSMTDQERTQTHIGPFLRHVRNSMGLSLRGAAAITHVNFTYLGQVERMQKQPSDVWITGYVKLLGEHRADTEHAAS
jgi:cytoskeletal protein RodZ